MSRPKRRLPERNIIFGDPGRQPLQRNGKIMLGQVARNLRTGRVSLMGG